nr:Rne/Rng family ribonuclease [uncultured Actinotalea sp.]
MAAPGLETYSVADDRTTPDTAAPAASEGTAPRARRSRRATSATTAPRTAAEQASAPTTPSVPDAPTTTAGGAAVADDAASGSTAPRRRSRRATAPAGAATAQAPADAAPAEQQDRASSSAGFAAVSPDDSTTTSSAPRARRSRKVAPAEAAPAADGAAATDDAAAAPQAAEEAPAPRRRRRKADAEQPGTAAQTATAGEEADGSGPGSTDAATGPDTESATKARAGRRGTRSRTTRTTDEVAGGDATNASATTAAATDGVPEVAAAAPSADDAAATGGAPAPKARSRRGGRTRGASAAEPTPAQDGGLDVLAELGGAEPDADAGTARGDEPARPAATALLFQAPEPTARPRRRRAQAPAGPPRPDETVEQPDEEEPTGAEEETTGAGYEDAVAEATGGDAGAEDGPEREPGADEDADDGDEDEREAGRRRRRRRGGRGRRSRAGDRADGDEGEGAEDEKAQDEKAQDEKTQDAEDAAVSSAAGARGDSEDGAREESDEDGAGSSRRRRRRRRSGRGEGAGETEAEPRSARRSRVASDEVTALKGSTRLEAKRQRRREGRDAGRRRSVITEAEFLARREAVDRAMVVREHDGRVQIAVLEDGVLVEHFVSRTGQGSRSSATTVGNVYLGRVQNVLPSMEAAFVDVGKGRNAVLYAGEVNWDAAGLEGQPRRIEQALKSGDSVLVQVTKDPIGHKGARLTSQITLAGRYLVYVPGGAMTGISRKLPDTERARLKKLLKEIVPDDAGVIVRTAAEGASDEELRRDVQRLQDQWAAIEKKAKSASAPALLQGEPDLAIRVVRDIFNDDFRSLVVQGDDVHRMIEEYVSAMAPDLADRVSKYAGTGDVFADHRVDEQLAKGMDRKVWLPSGGSLVIDRTEAMTVVDVNTGKFTGAGGTLEETVTRNNLEAAEEIVRQLRLRDIGGIIVIDFIDMVLESNRDLVLRRLVECLGRDRTKHQVAEVTSLGLVQMTRKRVGQGLVESFSETCEHCHGRGFVVHDAPVERSGGAEAAPQEPAGESKRSRRKKGGATSAPSAPTVTVPVLPEAREAVKATLATIAAAAAHAHEHEHPHEQASAVVLPELEQLARAVGGGEASRTDGAPDDGVRGRSQQPDQAQAALAELADAVGSIRAVEAPAADDDAVPGTEGASPDPASDDVDPADPARQGPDPAI